MRLVLWTVAVVGCTGTGPEPVMTPEPPAFMAVDATETWQMDGLQGAVQVVRTEGNVPHIYAENDLDLARVLGFTYARDRYFTLDLARRLSAGTLSGLLGDVVLSTDMDSRMMGMTHVRDTLIENAPADFRLQLDAYAAGVNDYITAVSEGDLPPPTELELAGIILGSLEPATLMEPWTGDDVASVMAALVYQLGYDPDDVARGLVEEQLAAGVYAPSAPFADLRTAAVNDDVWGRIHPVYELNSAQDWGARRAAPTKAAPPHASGAPARLIEGLVNRMGRFNARLGQGSDERGSNAWAVMGTHTADGRSLLAGDGHIPLSIPSLFWQVGLDTEVLGSGGVHQLGLGLPGLPTIAVGTNGKVAWSQTRLRADVTDWYTEELQLDEAGVPKRSLFDGTWEDLVATDESIEVAEVLLLGSVGRSETFTRWTTFDGRWIVDIEGEPVEADHATEPGQAVIALPDRWIVPGDTDGDGVISGISFDFTGLDRSGMMIASTKFGRANNVDEFRDATQHLNAYAQNLVASDADGSVLYTSYQAVPCRDYLDRDGGVWAPGSNPFTLLDGTRHPGFEIPSTDDLRIDPSFSDDPSRCVMPEADTPWSKDPAQGFVVNANQDPSGSSFDNSLANDTWYHGGPWDAGVRAHRITELLQATTADAAADIPAMQDIQNDHRSGHAVLLLDHLLDALDGAQADPDSRPGAVWTDNALRFAEARSRLDDWAAGGWVSHSGVETFYHPSVSGIEADNSVATSIFNAWQSHLLAIIFDDEGLPDNLFQPYKNTGALRTLTTMLEGRGPGNTEGLSGYNPDTEESILFDVLDTPEVETSDVVILMALSNALDTLASDPIEAGVGGYGTEDMDEWRWGLRHVVAFKSLLAGFLGEGDPALSALTEPLAITTDVLPLASGLSADDPRSALDWFPRPGDNSAVDAATFGYDIHKREYVNGPVFRMVIALGPDGVSGENILPGGQSALIDSPHFADQAAIWLANETWPMRFTVDEVVEGSTHREAFEPR